MIDFPWLKNYPKGIPYNIDSLEYQSLMHFFEDCCMQNSNRVAFVNMGATITYGQLDKYSRDFAAYLQSIGLQQGDRIAIQMPNLLQFPIAFIGAIRAGLIVVNTNPLYTPREMEHQFIDAEVKAIVIVANFAANLEKIIANTPIEHVIVTHMGDMLGTVKGSIVDFVVKYIKKLVPNFNLQKAISFKKVLQLGASANYNRPEIAENDVAVLQYTGGTTGVSKGAQLTHRNLLSHTMMTHAWFKPWLNVNKAETMITALPLYHIFALSVNMLLMIRVGAKIILITNPRDIPAFVKDLSREPFTIITGVNTLFNALLHNEKFLKLDFSQLKGAVGGGMAVQDTVAKKWKHITGTALVEGYGLSETSPVLCCNPLDGSHKMGTIGLPMPSTEVAIFDEQGTQLAQGEQGEICARGPQVMSSYWNKDNEGIFFPGEWFRTGDIGLMDEDGFFKIVDRKKDMIKVSGFNVFPNEIENIASGHPKVLEVAAIGVPDEKSGEVIKVFIVKQDESLNKDEFIAFCKENMTAYKVPKHVEFRKELPKTNVGKILRRELKEEEAKKQG
jgi:long-chain acyl-CoA synthetase